MKPHRIFRVLPALLAVLLAVMLAGCASQAGEETAITHIRQLDGQTIGVMTGSTFDQHTDTYINDAKKEYYSSYADMALAVEQGKVAAFLMDEPMARVLCAENPGVTYLEEYLTEDGYAFAFPKTEKGALLRDQMNEFLAQIQADGTIPCTACSYCTDGCPQHIPIPTLFALYNRTLGQPGPMQKKEYREACAQGSPASACIACRQCEGACPQHLEVVGQLQRVSAAFEG